MLMALVLIVVIVNATRIERIRSDMASSGDKYVLPEIESLLIRGEGGERVPKKAYWLKVNPDANPASDVEELSIVSGDGSGDTDAVAFETDVSSGRVRYVYRPDQRSMFSVERSAGKYLVRPVSSSASGLRLVPPGMSEPRKATLVGLPVSLVSATAGTV